MRTLRRIRRRAGSLLCAAGMHKPPKGGPPTMVSEAPCRRLCGKARYAATRDGIGGPAWGRFG